MTLVQCTAPTSVRLSEHADRGPATASPTLTPKFSLSVSYAFYAATILDVKSCAAIALLYYDHILTFPAEVSHVWSQPISPNTLLFLLNRYVALLGNIVVPLTGFSGVFSSTVRRQSAHELPSHSHLILSPPLYRGVSSPECRHQRELRTNVTDVSCTTPTYVRQALLVLSQVLVSSAFSNQLSRNSIN